MAAKVCKSLSVYPEVESALETYHSSVFPACDRSIASETGSDAEQIIAPDDKDRAIHIAKSNNPQGKLWRAIHPQELWSNAIFLYGNLARPDFLASVLTDKSPYRTYEQAVRMAPARLLNFEITSESEGSVVLGLEPRNTGYAEGMLLFSTTGRERELLRNHKGPLFKEIRAQALMGSKGQTPETPTGCSNDSYLQVLTYAWRDGGTGLESIPMEWR